VDKEEPCLGDSLPIGNAATWASMDSMSSASFRALLSACFLRNRILAYNVNCYSMFESALGMNIVAYIMSDRKEQSNWKKSKMGRSVTWEELRNDAPTKSFIEVA
jgi:hypothetical protein